jgi:DNA-directed RNA polymerase
MISSKWFKIQQRYLKTAKAKVSISIGRGKTKTVVLNKKLDKTNTRAQTQAIIPNIIHSMDSAHLILILNKIVNQNNTNNPVISIHDCFGTLPNNMISLENLVKLEFINLYSKKEFLENFNNDLINILDKNKIYYEINKLEHKVYIYLDRNNDYKNTTISLNKNKKLEPIVF